MYFSSPLIRSSHPEVFLEKDVLKIYSKFTGEHPCRSAISIKLRCSASFSRNTSGWLLLTYVSPYLSKTWCLSRISNLVFLNNFGLEEWGPIFFLVILHEMLPPDFFKNLSLRYSISRTNLEVIKWTIIKSSSEVM